MSTGEDDRPSLRMYAGDADCVINSGETETMSAMDSRSKDAKVSMMNVVWVGVGVGRDD